MPKAKCFICQEDELDWQCVEGKWKLFDQAGEFPHVCPEGAREKFWKEQEEAKKQNKQAIAKYRESNGYL